MQGAIASSAQFTCRVQPHMSTPKSTPSPSSPTIATRCRKRTKTFTGCWTCRARKIKCDEAKPHCQQCRDKCLDCEGYGSRLQWLVPETLDKSSSRSEIPSPPRHALRRHIPAEPPKSILSWSQVDGILRSIDSVELSRGSSNGGHVCANIQNFGVFGSKEVDPVYHDGATSYTVDSNIRHDTDANLDFTTASFPPSFLEPLNETFDSPSYSETAAAWDLCNLQASQLQLHPLNFTEHQGNTGTDIVIDPALTQPHQDDSNWENDPLKEPTPENTWQLIPPQFRSLSPNILSQQDRFLMCHYMNKVVNLFCVIDNKKSPWKTIHLPRVLQSTGELSFGGDTSRIRNALKNALLSISAFYLSNELHSSLQKDEGKKWAIIAARYRFDSIRLLKQSVELDLYARERPKYKEFLATMLSMITINVMSNDCRTCGVHLDGAEQLIRHMTARKSHFSRKAHALHRIYLYLRVIYESTAVKPVGSSSSRFSSFFDAHSVTRPELTAVSRHFFLEDNESASSAAPRDPNRNTVQDAAAEMAAYECIYGIPQILLIMLKEAIELIDKVEHERKTTKSFRISDPLDALCDNLEKDIMDWPLDQCLKKCREVNTDVSAEIIYHQTRAFHNALIIYFSQSVRLLGNCYLRHYVEAILDSIEAIERIKTETKILAAPLFWPAFIGATEAFEPQHQDRFRQWHLNVAAYGIEAVRTGIQVVHEVWSQGPTPSGQLMSSWRRIVAKSGNSLMLT